MSMEPQMVKSAERTVRILETLAASRETLTLSELQQRTGFPRSSLHALMRTLVELNWVETDSARSAFASRASARPIGPDQTTSPSASVASGVPSTWNSTFRTHG